MIDSKLLEAAANWWAEQISGHKLNWDNGAQNEGSAEDRRMGNMMWMLGNVTANRAREGVTPEKLQKFKESLIRRMSETYKKAVEYYPGYHLTLSVDYGPDELLNESAKEAEIDSMVFPCKTAMWIDVQKVSARLGYGAKEKIIAEL
jgi:hypothetical protein